MEIQLSDHFDTRKLIRFTMPSILMMVITSVYGIVDGFFISNFTGKSAFAAVNLIIPFLMVLSTVGFMFGTGGSALVAKTYGEGNKETANKQFSLFVCFTFGVALVLALLGFAFMPQIAELLGATGELRGYCVVYGRIIICALPFYALQFLFQSFMVTAEKPKLGFKVSVMAGATNVVLDAVLVTLLPENYKLAGAAVATAMAQIVGGAVPLIYFARKNSSYLRIGKCSFDAKAIRKATINGSSEFMSNISMNVVGMLYNIQLMHYAGEDGVSAYGVMLYVSFVFVAIFIGYSIGSAPLVSFHYGAQNHGELKNLLKKSLWIVLALGVAMTTLGALLARPFAMMFVGYDAGLLELTTSGLRIYALAFLFIGLAILASGFFTALNDGVTSAIISFLRTLVFQIASVLLLPMVLGVDGIWYSIVVAEVMAVTISALFLVGKRKRYQYY